MKTICGCEIVKDNQVKAINEDGLPKLLTTLGVKDKFDSGECLCFFCHEPINAATLASLFPKDGQVEMICNRPECYIQMVGLGGNSNGGDT